jgi:hypothetical protein
MNRRIWICCLAGLCAAAIVSSRVLSQDEGQDKPDKKAGGQDMGGMAGMPDMAEMMKKWQAAVTPGPMHKMLECFVGEWNTKTKVWMGGPDSSPAETKGKSTVKWIMDGRFLMDEMHGEMLMPNEKGEMVKKPMKGLGIYGYDNFRHMFTGTWVDNQNTHMLNMAGMVDPSGKVFTWYGEMDEPTMDVRGRLVKYQTKIIDENKHVFAIYDLHAGEGYKVIEVTYTRAK